MVESDTFSPRTRPPPRARPCESDFYRGRGTSTTTRTIGVPLILRHRDEVSYAVSGVRFQGHAAMAEKYKKRKVPI